MLSISLVLHANLQYAEIPKKEIPQVVKESYLPTLKGLLKIKKSKIALHLTGVTLEILNQNYPEIIKIVREGIKNNQFEMMGGTYAHPILPLLPPSDIKKQIESHLEISKKILGENKPKGFWLPEAAWSPDLAPILKELGFEWTPIDYDHFLLSQIQGGEIAPSLERKPLSFTEKGISFLRIPLRQQIINLPSLYFKFRHDINDSSFEPILIQGVNETIQGILVRQVWSPFYFAVTLANKWPFTPLGLKKRIKKIAASKKTKGLLIPFGHDLEIIGYKDSLPINIPVPAFLGFVNWTANEQNLSLVFPSEYLKNNPPKKTYYLRTGSWAPDRSLKIWSDDPDDRRLNSLCNVAREKILKMPTCERKEKAWKHLMLAENSDGRGFWNPLPERRLDCFENALKAIETAETI